MSKKPKFKRLTPIEKEEIREHWRLGTFTAAELADTYNVSESTISRAVEGIAHGEAEARIKEIAQAAAADEAENMARVKTERIQKVKEDAFKRADTLIRLVMREIGQAVQNGTPFGTIAPSLKTLKMAMETVKVGRDELYTILGIDPADVDERELPELIFRIVSDEEIRSLAQRQATTLEMDSHIVVEEDDDRIVIDEMED